MEVRSQFGPGQDPGHGPGHSPGHHSAHDWSVRYLEETAVLVQAAIASDTASPQAIANGEALQRHCQILLGLAQATQVLLANHNVSAAIAEALELLQGSMDLDRLYLCEHHREEEGGAWFELRFEAVAAPHLARLDGPLWQDQHYAAAGLHQLLEHLEAGEMFGGPLAELPRAEQQFFGTAAGEGAVLILPLWVQGGTNGSSGAGGASGSEGYRLWGFLGVEDCRSPRRWTPSERWILQAGLGSIGAALERQQIEQQISYQASHDPLTGLPNRMMFNHRLPQAIAQARRSGEQLAVMFLDLDRFKWVNDTLGHAMGDLLLVEVIQRLQVCLREEDTLARWGGDEFTLCLPNLKSSEDAVSVSQRLLEMLRSPFDLGGQEVNISASIGIALYPQDGQDFQTLLRNADAALYRVKEMGRNHFQFYELNMNAEVSERLSREQQLRLALAREEFVLYYQPRFANQVEQTPAEQNPAEQNLAEQNPAELPQGRPITGIEVLLRWLHPTEGLLLPAQFLGVAESVGLTIDLGRWVIARACAQLRSWQQQGLPPVQLALNLSSRQFQDTDLPAYLREQLLQYGIPPQRLEVELTEGALGRNPSLAQDLLQPLRALGVGLAIDNFGTGYSCLEDLRDWPITALKIAAPFVQSLPDPTNQAIIGAIIALGQGLNLKIIAEGVETTDQVTLLRALGCGEVQGNALCNPLDTRGMTQLLRDRAHHRTNRY